MRQASRKGRREEERKKEEIKYEGRVTYQSDKNAEELYNISICHRVEPAH